MIWRLTLWTVKAWVETFATLTVILAGFALFYFSFQLGFLLAGMIVK